MNRYSISRSSSHDANRVTLPGDIANILNGLTMSIELLPDPNRIISIRALDMVAISMGLTISPDVLYIGPAWIEENATADHH